MTDPENARDSLASLAQDRGKLSKVITTPPSRHLAYAAMSGLLIAAVGFPTPVSIAMLAVGMAATVAIYRWDLQRDGAFVNGYQAGPTRPLTLVLLLLTAAFVGFGLWGRRNGETWPAIVAGLAFVPVAYAFSVRWMTVYRRGLEG